MTLLHYILVAAVAPVVVGLVAQWLWNQLVAADDEATYDDAVSSGQEDDRA